MQAALRRPFTSSAVAPAAGRRTLVVVAVKPTTASSFRGLTDEELYSKVGELKIELAGVRFLQRTRGIEEMKAGATTQPQQDVDKMPRGNVNKHLRTQVAQMLTILREREIKEGVNRRRSKAMQRRAAVAAK